MKTRIKFLLFGDDGVSGSYDLIVDGAVDDIKSASTGHTKQFESMTVLPAVMVSGMWLNWLDTQGIR